MKLIKYFPFLFGDMITENTPVWKFFLTLRQILVYLDSQSLQVEIAEQLRIHIFNYFRLQHDLFPTEKLKPKHHYLSHYPDLITLIGPIIHA